MSALRTLIQTIFLQLEVYCRLPVNTEPRALMRLPQRPCRREPHVNYLQGLVFIGTILEGGLREGKIKRINPLVSGYPSSRLENPDLYLIKQERSGQDGPKRAEQNASGNGWH